MTSAAPDLFRATADGYAVRRPRSTDAIGSTLRETFGGEHALPEEFARYVPLLDRCSKRNRY